MVVRWENEVYCEDDNFLITESADLLYQNCASCASDLIIGCVPLKSFTFKLDC